jgi:aminocarboxymuconate-semialdehyde decarboxylase
MSSRREFLKELAGATAGVVFVGCGLAHAQNAKQPSGAAHKRREANVGGRRVTTVDIHCHAFVPDVWELLKGDARAQAVKRYFDGPQASAVSILNVDSRLKLMDSWGIDIQAVSTPPEYNYWADRDLASRIVPIQNEKIAALCAAHPDRFVGLGAVALQHPDLAAEQMEAGVKKLGLRGFEIGGSVNGEELSSPKFEPFWAKAEELGILIFIHPANFPEGAKRFQGKGQLENLIGNPLETTVALSHLIFEGTLDKHPGLKICGAHGGGYLPSYSGRSDRCFGDPQRCKAGTKRPSDYLKRIYVDSLVFTNEGLRHLIAEIGAGQIILGTDYPFGWEPDAVGYIMNAPGLSNDQRRAILGGNAARLLAIKG